MTRIILARDFSLYPMGRSEEDGSDNGQRFFTEFLLPHLEANTHVTVVFDGVHSFGSSFLDEAFHEMPASHNIGADRFKRLVSIEAKGRAYAFYKRMVESFIDKIPPAKPK
ncbi:STAS-like domain-containing protein [Hyphomonas sp. ND6WE1B]|uniref:STAS-like domain-containing protein n=1 Tax=Hyphomonas sp. ND6WE1B TaxID=1848191 RepID=UPI00080767C0|nr:STAS-like domain-containing protein [Hyphomonas sp. ND6WE1B]